MGERKARKHLQLLDAKGWEPKSRPIAEDQKNYIAKKNLKE